MQKCFNVTADFNLIRKPDWLDDFRFKYDKPYQYHITFKTVTNLTGNFDNLKNDLYDISKKYKPIQVIFNKLLIKTTSKGGCIMIEASYNENLIKLQKEISEKLLIYGKHSTEEHKQFEINFKPHLTIARHLTPKQLEEAKKELKENLRCEAKIEELKVSIASEDSFEEWTKDQNKSYFKLVGN